MSDSNRGSRTAGKQIESDSSGGMLSIIYWCLLTIIPLRQVIEAFSTYSAFVSFGDHPPTIADYYLVIMPIALGASAVYVGLRLKDRIVGAQKLALIYFCVAAASKIVEFALLSDEHPRAVYYFNGGISPRYGMIWIVTFGIYISFIFYLALSQKVARTYGADAARLDEWSDGTNSFRVGEMLTHDYYGDGMLSKIKQKADSEIRLLVKFPGKRGYHELKPEYLTKTANR